MPFRRLDPDTALRVTLHAYASRAVYDTRPPAKVISELEETAGKRTDILAAVMGLLIGSWRASSRLPRHHELADAFEALNLPGMAEGIALGWERGRRGGHNSRGFQDRPAERN
ncbi:hypothetical protein [Solicola sp. PLA-1-18]|uniref:hypothetical protein n=1 Tax=Solicola sp. PLA-1-18 TaxID=3380532 RepID=UPI003B80087D